LVSLVGADGGFVATCGDGGLVVRKTDVDATKTTVVVYSTDDLSVSGVVSLGSDALQFRQTRISMEKSTRLEIVMTTDGVDRSLRRHAGRPEVEFDPYQDEFPCPISSMDLRKWMEERLEAMSDREIDNVSSAFLSWPMPDSPAVGRVVYQGEIVPSNETVNHINARQAKRFSAGIEKIRLGQLSRLDRTSQQPLAGDSQKPINSAVGVRPSLGESEARKSDVALSRKLLGHPYDAFKYSSPKIKQALDLTYDVAAAYLRQHERAKAVDSLHQSSLEHLSLIDKATSRVPNFIKLMFYMFADQHCSGSFRSRLRADDELEGLIDNYLRAKCLWRPSVARQSFDFSQSHLVTEAVIRVVKHSTSQLPSLDLVLEKFFRPLF
jgi:hypothetical protein